MDSLRIGFLAGCINNQKGLGKDKLFHAEFASLFNRQATDIKLHISLGTYLSYDKVADNTKDFIEKNGLNLLCFFIRPFSLMPLHKLLVKHETAGNGKLLAIHPALFKRALKWDNTLTRYQSSNEYVYVKRSRFGFRDINLLLGTLFRLDKWAYKYVLYQVTTIASYCRDKNVKFIIVSPPRSPESIMGNFICTKVSSMLGKHCQLSGIPYVDINSITLDNFERDRIHFNERGHKAVAGLIFEKVKAEYPLRKQLMNLSLVS